MDFTVIIPTCNRPQSLQLCLDAVAAQTLEAGIRYEVVVCDDSANTEPTRQLVGSYPGFRYVRGPCRGPAANRNAGAALALGEWLVFLDDDCVPHVDWLAGYHRSISCMDVLEGRTVTEQPRTRLDQEAPENPTGGYLWSCNFAIKRALFAELRGFDEDYPYAAMEDVDLRHRLIEGGQTIHFVSTATCIHPWRNVNPAFYRKRTISWLIFLSKHPKYRPDSLGWHGLVTAARILLPLTRPTGRRLRFAGAWCIVWLAVLQLRDTALILWYLRFLKQTPAALSRKWRQ
jgi:GT2 family glycosyltransferase